MLVSTDNLIKAVQTVVGTRKYLPISKSEGIFILERNGYIHIFYQLSSTFGGRTAESVVERLLELKQDNKFEYHPELLELINEL